LEIKSLICDELKNSVESLTNRLDQVEDRISGLEGKEDGLEHLCNNFKNRKV
jgi:hypothetical protein